MCEYPKYIPLISLLILLIFSFLPLTCAEKGRETSTQANTEIIHEFWVSEIEKTQKVFFYTDGKNLMVSDEKGNVFTFSATNGWTSENFAEKLNLYLGTGNWKILGITNGAILVESDGKVYVYTVQENSPPLDSGIQVDTPHFFISHSKLIFWEEGKVKLKEDGKNSEDIFELGGKPEKLYALDFEGKIFVFWISEGKSYFFSEQKTGILGDFVKRQQVYFYLANNTYVAYTPEEILGKIEEGYVKLFVNSQEFKSFSYEIQGRRIVLYIDISPDELKDILPPNPYFEVEYRVSPEGKQEDFQVYKDLNGKTLYFVDTELQSLYEIPGTGEKIKICRSYFGHFDGKYFRRDYILPSSSCDVFSSSPGVFSFFDDLSKTSKVLFLWGSISSSFSLPGRAYPFSLSEFPYFIVFNDDISDNGNLKILFYTIK